MRPEVHAVMCCHPPPAVWSACRRRAISEPEAINCLCGTVKIQVLLQLLLSWGVPHMHVLYASLLSTTAHHANLDPCLFCLAELCVCVQSAGLMKMKQAAKKQGKK
jgi:hypothetical protein